jgi:hypothetical protein
MKGRAISPGAVVALSEKKNEVMAKMVGRY